MSVTYNKHSLHKFLENNAVDFPGKRGSSMPKKILTRPMADLFSDYKKKNTESRCLSLNLKEDAPHTLSFRHLENFCNAFVKNALMLCF